MNGTELFTVLVVFLLVGVSIYRIQTLHKKKIWNLSVQQLIHLVLIPGLLFPMIFSYLQSVVKLPANSTVIISDGFLVNTVLLSILFTYGGVAIHAVTKMMSEYLRDLHSEATEVNKFFHLTFSHNLVFTGLILASLGLTLLELNHIPLTDFMSVGWGVFRGVVLGISFGFATYNYARYTGESYQGRWNDLKMTFGSIWVAFALLLYMVGKLEVGFSEYDLLLPMLLSFSLMVGLSLILVVRRIKRGGWKVIVNWKVIQQLFGYKK